MRNLKTRLLSMFLAVVMLCGIAIIPASADTSSHHINVTYADNSTQAYANTNPIALHTFGAKDVEKVTINDKEYTDFSKTIEDTVKDGSTKFQLYTQTQKNGLPVLYFKYLNTLKDTINITVTGKEASYKVYWNSGVYGQANNRGGSDTCTYTLGNNLTTSGADITGGKDYGVTFVPFPGQEIVKLNIRADTTDGAGTLVDPKNGTVNVGGQSYDISVADGKVEVKTSSAVRTMYITALTKDETEKYTLTVDTFNCTSSVTSEMLERNATEKVKLTPDEGLTITEITIESNGKTGTIGGTDTSVSVNGKTYGIRRNLDGTVELSIPGMTADVTVTAMADNGYHHIMVEEGPHTNSRYDGFNYLHDGEDLIVTFTPRPTATIEGIEIKTGFGTFTAEADDSYIIVNNEYFRLDQDADGAVTVYLRGITYNMEVKPVVRVTSHEFSVSVDEGCSTDHEDSVFVDDGDNHTVTFFPRGTYTIRELKITYGGKLYTVDVDKDHYVVIAGERHPVTVDKDGAVTITIHNILEDVSVEAVSDYVASEHPSITKRTDGHSTINITYDSSRYDDRGLTITIYPDKGYMLSSVDFTTNTDNAVVDYTTQTFVLDGRTYQVVNQNDGSLSVYFDVLHKHLTVTSRTTNQTDTSSYTYHPAYITGYGNGLFGPNYMLTRAEIISMLTSLYTPNYEKNMVATYLDVSPSAWYYPQIAYAERSGYLRCIDGGNFYFYPDQNTTRAELLALLFSFAHIDIGMNYPSAFVDVPVNHWACNIISYAASQGWVTGYGNGVFNPDGPVTRAEAVTMINNILGRHADSRQVYPNSFTDVPYTHWAYYPIMEAANSHWVLGSTISGETWYQAK